MKLLGLRVSRQWPAKVDGQTDILSLQTFLVRAIDKFSKISLYKKTKKPLSFHNCRLTLILQSLVLVPGKLTHSFASSHYAADRVTD